MLHNVPMRPSMLTAMSVSSFDFFLTGSRFFGTAGGDSDWDFFVQDDVAVRAWLKTSGFIFHSGSSSYANDGCCVEVAVFGQCNENEINQSKQIHVQLVDNVALKLLVQKKLLERFPTGTFTRDFKEGRLIWSLAFEFLKLGMRFVDKQQS